MTRVLYPGSFDPIHNGHVELAETAAGLFDEVVVATLANPSKGDGLFDLESRMSLIQESLEHLSNVEVTKFDGLVVDLAISSSRACVPCPTLRPNFRWPR